MNEFTDHFHALLATLQCKATAVNGIPKVQRLGIP